MTLFRGTVHRVRLTGAASDRQAIARGLAADGAAVARVHDGAARRRDGHGRLAQLAGVRVCCDVTREDDVQAAFAEVGGVAGSSDGRGRTRLVTTTTCAR